MRQVTNSTFTDGLIMDLSPTITPLSCVTDCLNGTIITYNGNEYQLQNDLGNIKLNESSIPEGYIPLGMKEYGGIIYLALLDPINNRCEIGSIPSPDFDLDGADAGNIGIIEDWVDVSTTSTGSDSKGYAFSSLFMRLFEPEALQLNPGDMYALGYKVTSGVDPLDSTSHMFDVELYAVDENNRMHILDSPNFLRVNDDDTIGNIAWTHDNNLKYFKSTISAILGLKISLNEIDFFETYAYDTGEKVKIVCYGKNKLRGEGLADDQYIRGVKIESEDQVYYYITEEEKKRIENEAKPEDEREEVEQPERFDGIVEIDHTEKKGQTVSYKITPYDLFHYLEHLASNLNVTIGLDIDKKDEDCFIYKYDKSNKALVLKFNMHTLGYTNPYMYIEAYNFTDDFSTIIPVENINPAGLNTLYIDTVEDVFGDEAIYSGTENSKYPARMQPERIRVNSKLRENQLYFLRICCYDDTDNEVIQNKTSYKELYRFLIINELFNDLYQSVIDGDSFYVNFNNYDYNKKLSLDITFNHKIGEGEESEEFVDNFSVKSGDGLYYEVGDKEIQEKTETSLYVFTYKNNIKISNPLISTVTPFKTDVESVKVTRFDVSNLKIEDSLYGIDDTRSLYEVSIKDMTLGFELKSIKKISADLKSEQKYYQVAIDEKTIWDEMWKPNDYWLASTENYVWKPRGFYSFRDYSENVHAKDSDQETYFCYEEKGYDDTVTGEVMQKFLNGSRGSYGLSIVVNPKLKRSGMIMYYWGMAPRVVPTGSIYWNLGMFRFETNKPPEDLTNEWYVYTTHTEYRDVDEGESYKPHIIDPGTHNDEFFMWLYVLDKYPEFEVKSSYYLMRYVFFMNTKEKGAVYLTYSNYQKLKSILQDLKAYKFGESSSWISYYQNVTGDRYASKTYLTGSYNLSGVLDCKVKQKTKNGDIDNVNDLIKFIKEDIIGEDSDVNPGVYFSLGELSKLFDSLFTAPDFEIYGLTPSDLFNDLTDSYQICLDQNPNIFKINTISDCTVISSSGTYELKSKYFTAYYEDDAIHFYYNPTSALRVNMRWYYSKSERREAPYMDLFAIDE